MQHTSNGDIARILRGVAEYLTMESANPFRIRAYGRAAEAIESLEEDIFLIYKNGGEKALEAVPGVGMAIRDHVIEIFRTVKLG